METIQFLLMYALWLLFAFLSIAHFCGLYNILRYRIPVEATIVKRSKKYSRASYVEYDYEYIYDNKKYTYTSRYYGILPIYKKNRVVNKKYNIYINKYYEDFRKLPKSKSNLSFWKLSIMGSHQCMISWVDEFKKSMLYLLFYIITIIILKGIFVIW